MEATFDNARVLITGGLGFIGSNLACRLVHAGAHVTLVDSLAPQYGGSPHNIRGIADQVQVHITDVREEKAIRQLVQGQDFLFNLAGQTSHMDSMRDPVADLEMNCRAPLAVLEACRKHNPRVRIVFAGTRQCYGKPLTLPVPEQHPLQPVDVNGIHKMAGEMYHLLYGQVHGLSVCSLRLTNTLGPRMRIKDARQTFVGIWIRQLIEGRPFEVWGGQQRRDFTYVDDAVDALLRAAASPRATSRVYNVGGREVVSLEQLAQLLIEVNLGGQYVLKPFPAERQAIDIGDYYADYSRIRDELGWQPQTSLHDALRLTLAYFRENLPHYL